MSRRRWFTAFVLVALTAGAFLLDRLGMKGVRWRMWAPALDHHGAPLPESALGSFVQRGATSTAHQTFFRDGSSYAWGTREGAPVFLLFRDGEATATGYLARDIVSFNLAVRYPFGETFRAEAAPCDGEAVFEDGEWTLSLSSAACRDANGAWTRWEPPTPVQTDDRACTRYVACACDLSVVQPELFAQACREARGMIGVAPDDPEACSGGLATARQLASPLHIALPASCGDG